MTPNNDVETRCTAILLDGSEGLDRDAADCESVGFIEPAQAIIWPTWQTQHMTATWGS